MKNKTTGIDNSPVLCASDSSRSQRTEEKMNIRESITNSIVQALESGVPPWRSGWAGGALSYNGETGKAYQGINQLLLGMSGYADPRWMTIKQANKMGCRVRKGEKSTRIVRLVEVERRDANAEESDGEEQLAQDQQRMLVLRQYAVFNGSQIEGIAPLPARAHAIDPIKAADGVVDGLKATGLILLHGGSSAHYSPKLDTIRMPEKPDFYSTQDYYSTLLHECAHATGAAKRLNRPNMSARFGTAEYAKEELRAELASAMLSVELGVPIGESHVQSHAAYLASWLQALKNDKNEIFRAATAAQQIADYLQEIAIKPKPEADEETDDVAPAVPLGRPAMQRHKPTQQLRM